MRVLGGLFGPLFKRAISRAKFTEHLRKELHLQLRQSPLLIRKSPSVRIADSLFLLLVRRSQVSP